MKVLCSITDLEQLTIKEIYKKEIEKEIITFYENVAEKNISLKNFALNKYCLMIIIETKNDLKQIKFKKLLKLEIWEISKDEKLILIKALDNKENLIEIFFLN